MPFEIIWTKRSEKDLKLIDRKIDERIIVKVDELGEQETVFLEKIKNSPDYKFRVGKYRVILEKFPATRKLFVLRVRHRRNAYKKT